jgi:hypothetical protein
MAAGCCTDAESVYGILLYIGRYYHSPQKGRILCIPDVKYGVYILSHVLILDPRFNHSFLKSIYFIIRK